MNRIRRRPRWMLVMSLAALVSLVALAPLTRAQVLDQIPSNVLVVIKVNNLKATSDKVAKYMDALGLAALSPELADPLASLQQNMKVKEGMDTAGELAFVMVKPAKENSPPEDSMMFLLPVSDYKAFLSNFENVKTEGAISSFKAGEELHSANWGKYAVVAQNKDLLSQKPAGLKLSPIASEEAKEKDAFIYANIPALAELALPELKKARAEALGEIDREIGKDADAKQFAGVAKAAVTQCLNVAEGFLKDSTGASLSLHLNDEGLMITSMAEFKPESYAGKIVSQLKNTDQPLLGGLPNRKFFFAGGSVNDPKISGQVVGDLLDPISKELANTEAAKGFASAIEAFKKGNAATHSMAFGLTMPTGALGADSIIQQVMVAKGDAATIAASQKTMLQGVADLFKLMPNKPDAPKFSYEYSPAAKMVGDLKLDSYAFNMAIDENNPQAAQIQQIMAFIYGPNGMGGTVGAVNKETYVMVQGGTDKLLQDVVASAKDGKDTLSGQGIITSVGKHLPAKRVGAGYLFLDNIINTGVKYAQGFGLQVKVQLPADLPPIAGSIASEGSALRVDGFVPTHLVQSVVAAGMQTYVQMNGGGAGKDGQ